jgi:hypothetical protein
VCTASSATLLSALLRFGDAGCVVLCPPSCPHPVHPCNTRGRVRHTLPALPLVFPQAVSTALDQASSSASSTAAAVAAATPQDLANAAQAGAGLAASAWQSATAPFALFGEGEWGLNLLFLGTAGFFMFVLVSAPKQ